METYNIELDDKNLIKLKDYFKDKNIVNQDFLLNKQKTNYDIIEEVVDYISKFHINRLKLTEEYYIEFCFSNIKRNQHNILVNKYPVLTCITYLNEDNSLAIITNMLIESYKYKEINDDIKLYCLFPSELKSIVLPGCLQVIDEGANSNRLIINIWKSEPLTNNYYHNSNKIESIVNLKINKDDNRVKTIMFGNEMEYGYFENLIYSNEGGLQKELLEMINKNKSNTHDVYLFLKENNKNQKEEVLDEANILNLLETKYSQKYYNKSYYNNIVCDWIMKEIDKYSLNSINSEIPLENIETIVPFILYSSMNIIELIEEYYNINGCKFNIKNIYVKKDNVFYQKNEETLIVNIMLTNNEKNGDKYICFDSGIKIKLNMGDMVVYNGEDRFTMLSCSNNYVLVIVINVYKK